MFYKSNWASLQGVDGRHAVMWSMVADLWDKEGAEFELDRDTQNGHLKSARHGIHGTVTGDMV